MTKAQFISYWNERHRAIQAHNADMAMHHLQSLPEMIERRRKREVKRKLPGTLFPEMSEQEWRVISLGVIRKLLGFLKWSEWMIEQDQKRVIEVAGLMKEGVDYAEFDNYPKLP